MSSGGGITSASSIPNASASAPSKGSGGVTLPTSDVAPVSQGLINSAYQGSGSTGGLAPLGAALAGSPAAPPPFLQSPSAPPSSLQGAIPPIQQQQSGLAPGAPYSLDGGGGGGLPLSGVTPGTGGLSMGSKGPGQVQIPAAVLQGLGQYLGQGGGASANPYNISGMGIGG